MQIFDLGKPFFIPCNTTKKSVANCFERCIYYFIIHCCYVFIINKLVRSIYMKTDYCFGLKRLLFSPRKTPSLGVKDTEFLNETSSLFRSTIVCVCVGSHGDLEEIKRLKWAKEQFTIVYHSSPPFTIVHHISLWRGCIFVR